ncbi:MAG: hypothetical protein HUK21_01145 [Fibrobacteraceae bacterium]|nr:hypothetical protein [Fibrobacteraceae bacterium]
MKPLLILLLFFTSFSWASYFLEETSGQNAPKEEMPILRYGVNLDVAYYLFALDAGANGVLEFRLQKNQSLDVFAGGMFSGKYLTVGSNYRLFWGDLLNNFHDDFFRLGLSGLYFENYGENYFSPVVSLGYGRDFLFFEKAHFLFRFEVGLSYIMGENISENTDKLIDKETSILVHLNCSIFWF